MNKKSKIINRVSLLVLLILCFQGIFGGNSSLFAQGKVGNLQAGEIYTGIVIDALATTNTTNSGNWTWAVDQSWCSNDSGVYVIEDMIINNTSGTTRGSGIFINNSHDVDFRIENCTITDVNAIISYSAGIDIENSSRGVIYNNSISDTNPIGCGIQLLGFNCHNITIERNIVTNILRHAILMYGGNEIHVINNTVNNVAYNGIYFYQGVQNSTIAYNYVNDTNNNEMSGQNGGIKLYQSNNDNNQIFNNSVENCWRGIYLYDSSINSIYNNTVKNNDEAGIILSTNSNDNNVTNNIVTNENGDYEQDYGIWLSTSHNNTISQNHISNQRIHGMILQSSRNNTITENSVDDNQIMGIFLTDSTNGNSINDNSINRNDLGMGLSYCEFNNISENILIGNGYCIYEVECGTNFITNNTCSESFITLPLFIDDSATGIGANNWTWAETQPWFSGGGGTESDPYIIENLLISSLGFDNHGITIVSSNVYFIIRNCSIYNCDTGIDLDNVNNSQIIGNDIYDCDTAIYMQFCANNTISDNTISNNEYGIYEYGYCDNISITDNTVSRGEYGIYLDAYCTNTTIARNFLSENDCGIFLYDHSSNNTIGSNTISGSDDAIYLYSDSNNNSISGNIVSGNGNGIYLESSDSNLVTENVLKNNTLGITIDPGEFNLIYYNFFVNNELHAQDDGTNNVWNSTTIGNYWDNWTTPDDDNDGIVDSPYTFIEGSAGSNDSLPIAEDGPPQISISYPLKRNRFARIAPSFIVEVSDLYVWEMWYTLDGGLHNYTFTVNGTIDQLAWEALPYGKVTIQFYVSDIAGNIMGAEVTVIKYSQTLRIVYWILIGVAVAIGAAGYYLIKLWKIKLEE